MSETADVVIIGAGIIGTAIAFELAKAGYKPLTVDANPAAGYGPTSASCAIIRVHYSTLEGTAMAYEGYFHWRDWAEYLGVVDERGLAEFRETGCLVMQTEINGMLARHVALAEKLGIPFELWDADTVETRLPGYDMARYGPPRLLDDPRFGEPSGGRVAGGVFFPTAGYVSDPQLASHNLQRAAQAHGARFHFNQRVVAVLKAGGRVAGVELADGTAIAAPVVVNVAGPHSSILNRMAGALEDMTISTRALRQEVAHLPAPDGIDFDRAGMVISDSDIGCYCRPEQGNHILVGSEDPACDSREWVDPDTYNRDFSDQWTAQARRYGQRMPSLGIPHRAGGVVDLYDVSDDWIPIYDRSSVPGFYMAIGTSGNQFKNAPVAGKVMAALIAYCESGGDHDHRPLSLDLAYTGRMIDVGFYSRKRPINPDSSFSVLG